MNDVLADKTVTARKRHLCGLCERTIEPGEKYNAQTIADGGNIGTARSHIRCVMNYWAYWAWLGVPRRDVDPWLDEPDPSEFRLFLDSTYKP